MEKKLYEQPEMQVISVGMTTIVTTSGGNVDGGEGYNPFG